MKLGKLCRSSLTGIIAFVSLSCTTSTYTLPDRLIENSGTGIHTVGFTETDGVPMVVRAQTKLVPKVTAKNYPGLNFSSAGFKQVSEQAICIELICWDLWFYEPAKTQTTDMVIAEVNAKLQKAFSVLPATLRGREPYRLEVYLVPPDSAFHDGIENRKVGINKLKYAIHHGFYLPVTNRARRNYEEIQALSISTLVHEFVHFALLKTDYYEKHSAYPSVVHGEMLGKCYEYLSFLKLLDRDSKVSLIAYPDTKPKTVTHKGLDTATWDANDFLISLLRDKFVEAGSTSVVGNQIFLSARDDLEIGIIERTCNRLLAGEIEIEQ